MHSLSLSLNYINLSCRDIAKSSEEENPGLSCVKTATSGIHGHAMISNCPPGNTDKELEASCSAQVQVGLALEAQPVTDEQTKKTFKNLFCAKCNGAQNWIYWQFKANCPVGSQVPSNSSLLLKFVRARCKLSFQLRAKVDIRAASCVLPSKCAAVELVASQPLLSKLCGFYALPICYNPDQKNPHCALCNGNEASLQRDCPCGDPGSLGPLPGLSSMAILFDFSKKTISTFGYRKEVHWQHRKCNDGYIYDPFAEKCRFVYSKSLGHDGSRNSSDNSSSGACSWIKVDTEDAVVFANQTVLVKSAGKLFNKTFVNGTGVFICGDFKREYVVEEPVPTEEKSLTASQVITLVGCSLSVVALVILLFIYARYKELRNLPGLNLMGLAVAMVLYHVAFFLTGQSGYAVLCKAVAVCLHYFLLCSFAWMAVMAFDLTKTFASQGAQRRRST